MDAKLVGQKVRDVRALIPRIMSATVVSDSTESEDTVVAFDTAPDVFCAAQSLLGSAPPKGTRVKCLAYPPRGLLILGTTSNDAAWFERLRVWRTTDVSMTSLNHPFQIGPDSGLHLAMDNNEIQVRTGPPVAGVFAVGSLSFQLGGGNMTMGDASSIIIINGELQVPDVGILSVPMRHEWDAETTNQAQYNSATGSNGTPNCGFAFVAPPSGMGTFMVGAFGNVTGATAIGKVWGEIRTGGTVAAGTLVWDGDGDNGPEIRQQGVAAPGNRFYVGSNPALVTGLTPGNTYNASVWFAVEAAGAAGTGISVFARQVSFIPSP